MKVHDTLPGPQRAKVRKRLPERVAAKADANPGRWVEVGPYTRAQATNLRKGLLAHERFTIRFVRHDGIGLPDYGRIYVCSTGRP